MTMLNGANDFSIVFLVKQRKRRQSSGKERWDWPLDFRVNRCCHFDQREKSFFNLRERFLTFVRNDRIVERVCVQAGTRLLWQKQKYKLSGCSMATQEFRERFFRPSSRRPARIVGIHQSILPPQANSD